MYSKSNKTIKEDMKQNIENQVNNALGKLSKYIPKNKEKNYINHYFINKGVLLNYDNIEESFSNYFKSQNLDQSEINKFFTLKRENSHYCWINKLKDKSYFITITKNDDVNNYKIVVVGPKKYINEKIANYYSEALKISKESYQEK